VENVGGRLLPVSTVDCLHAVLSRISTGCLRDQLLNSGVWLSRTCSMEHSAISTLRNTLKERCYL